MFDIPEWVLPLLAIFLGTGGIGTIIVTLRSDVRKGPIERSAAQIANAVAVSAAAAELVDKVSSRMTEQDDRASRQDERASKQDEHIRSLRNEVMTLSSKIDRINFMWNHWYLDLRDDWDMHRTRTEAPPPPKID